MVQVSDMTEPVSWIAGQYKRVQGILQGIGQVKITVFGDFCVDAYWVLAQGEAELSIETGLPVLRVRSQHYSLGGAGNVVANLAAMGVGQVRAVGVAGDDLFGGKLRAMLAECGAHVDGMLVEDGWQTMVYAKPYAEDREQPRIDFGAFNDLSAALADRVIEKLAEAAEASDAIVLNQQVPGGISSPEVIAQINAIIEAHPDKLFLVDARHHPEKYAGAVLKLNMSEAAQFLGETSTSAVTEAQAKDFALRIEQRIHAPAFLTRGELGMVAAAGDEATVIPGLQILGSIDTVGAGDAVTAGLAASLGAKASPVDAAIFANFAAAVTVKKLRMTGTASGAEILALAAEPNYVFRPELAESPRRAAYLPGAEIEVVRELPSELHIEHCVFDHDGTLSTLREGWDQVMETMMVRAILGPSYDSADEASFDGVARMARSLIDRTTGVPTLIQMRGLVDLIRQCGFVPASEILDEHGYKRIYNGELLAMISERVDKLRRGELQPADFQIKGAASLLERLYRLGVKLYLASGTDQADVRAEAEAMGYARWFEGRIFGASGNGHVDAKKMVLDEIVGEQSRSGRGFATFGDGPAEIRETQRRGGISIGVASNEQRRFGLNPAKRKRLIRAGADLIIPDFTQSDALLTALQLSESDSPTMTGVNP